MNRFKFHVSVLVLSTLLAGCGSHGTSPMAMTVKVNTYAAASAKANKSASSLIAKFKALKSFDQASMTERDAITVALGKTDSDQAVQFLMSEHDLLPQYPAASRKAFQMSILKAMIELDNAGFVPTTGSTTESETPLTGTEAAVAAAAHHSRHMSFIHWATTPLRWLDEGIRWFLGVVNGHGGGRKPKPAPGPAPAPKDASPGGGDAGAPPADPAAAPAS